MLECIKAGRFWGKEEFYSTLVEDFGRAALLLEAVNNKRANKQIKSINDEITEGIINTQCVYIGNQESDRS